MEGDHGGFATGEKGARVTCLTDGGFNKGRIVPATLQLILNAKTVSWIERLGPLSVDFALKIERPSLVRDVARSNEQAKTAPKE